MKTKYISISMALLALAFTACQREDHYDGPCQVKVRAFMQEEVTVTRGYTTDLTAYADFTAELFVSNGTTVNSSFMKMKNQDEPALKLENGTYWFHGYAPWKDVATCTADAATTTMTIPEVPGVGTTDLLIIKGDNPLTITSTEAKTVALKMDHLMAKVTPCFYIDAAYAKMRSIRIKKVEFLIDDAEVYTATATYDLASPMTYNVAWTPTSTADLVATAYENASPAESDSLSQVKWKQAYGACYLSPAQSAEHLKMRVTYDVYDTAGALTRSDAVATNAILKLKDETLTAGTNYRLSIKVLPTYLYSLSDNDEDNALLLADD